MADLTVQTPAIESAIEALQDRSLDTQDRAALFAVLQQVKLRIERALRVSRDDIVDHMRAHELRDLGPIMLKSTAIDPVYQCNLEENWGDDGVQTAMREIIAKIAPEFVHHIPEHWEIRTAELGKAVAAGDPVAMQLLREIKDRGWRTEAGRRWTLAVRVAKPAKKDAAA